MQNFLLEFNPNNPFPFAGIVTKVLMIITSDSRIFLNRNHTFFYVCFKIYFSWFLQIIKDQFSFNSLCLREFPCFLMISVLSLHHCLIVKDQKTSISGVTCSQDWYLYACSGRQHGCHCPKGTNE